MIDRSLRQPTTWKRADGRDRQGQPTYAPDQTILCRWEWKRRQVRNLAGVEVVSESRVYTLAAVSVGDSLTDPSGRVWPVIAVSPQVHQNGRELYREVYV